MTIVLTVLLAVLKFVGWLLLFLLALLVVLLILPQTIADRLVRPAAFYALATGRCQRYGCTASRRAAASARSTTKR